MATIFVIDDEEGLLDLMKMAFNRHGFDVVCYSNPQDFLSSVSSLKGDVIVSDIRMPGMDGLDLIRAVKDKLLDDCRPFVFFTAYEDYDRQELMALGAVKVFQKPESFDHMAEYLRGILP